MWAWVEGATVGVWHRRGGAAGGDDESRYVCVRACGVSKVLVQDGLNLRLLPPLTNRTLLLADAAEEYGEEARALVDCLVEHNGLELLVQRLLSLNESVEEEARAVHNCLAVFENVVEVSGVSTTPPHA